MKVIYRFNDNTTKEEETNEEIGLLIEKENKQEDNYERKCRYWCTTSLDASEYEGEWFIDNNSPASIYEHKEEQEKVNKFLDTLTPTQRRRIEIRLDDPKISLREIARIENTDIKTIRECFESIKKKLTKFLESSPSK